MGRTIRAAEAFLQAAEKEGGCGQKMGPGSAASETTSLDSLSGKEVGVRSEPEARLVCFTSEMDGQG